MKFYVKIFKDGTEIFRGWNSTKKFKTLLKKLDKEEQFYNQYNVFIEDYQSPSKCGEKLLKLFEETTLYKFNELIKEIGELETAEDFYNDLDNNYGILPIIYDFEEDVLNEMFDSPYDAICASYFGKVNFNDNYFILNPYNNIETLPDIPYEAYSESIIDQWYYERF